MNPPSDASELEKWQRLDSRHTKVHAISIDGTDWCVWEKKDPRLPVDKRQCSHKFNHGSLKCEIGLSILNQSAHGPSMNAGTK